jgi:transcription antitermination factor NusA-like protein
VLDDEGNELLLPKTEQIPADYFKKGDSVRAIIEKVEMLNGNPKIIISRTAPEFLQRLFEMEVPEIFDGLITIKKIVREPGERAKVAVESYDDRIDPVGACVGMKGSRIHGIVRELKNENIDVINFTNNISLYIQRALSPAKITSIKLDEEEKRAATLISSFWKNASKIKITNTQDLQLQQKINGLVTNYMKEIDQFTADTHFLKDPKFSINDLANKLNIPKSHLAYLFKYHSTISFSDFKKVVRIKYALKLIAEDYLKTNTYDSLAKEIGFASYNTFFTSFKEIVGVTPHDYQN